MQRQGVGAGWRSQTASPGTRRCAEGPPEPYPYHLFIDCAPSSHSGAGYCSWHGRERGCGRSPGKEASPMLRGSPRLFNCAGSAGRSAARPRGEDTGVGGTGHGDAAVAWQPCIPAPSIPPPAP